MAGAGTDLATWGCGAIEAGVEDKSCVGTWAAGCGRTGRGAGICDCAGTGDGVAAETCALFAACAGGGRGAATWVCTCIEG